MAVACLLFSVHCMHIICKILTKCILHVEHRVARVVETTLLDKSKQELEASAFNACLHGIAVEADAISRCMYKMWQVVCF